jgi:hypothetical protein
MSEEHSISRLEWRRVVITSVLVMVITLLPYLYGYISTPQNKVYLGVRLNNFPDTNSYLSWIEQGRHEVLLKQLNSSELQRPALFHPLFLITSIGARLFNQSNIVLYHAFRFLGGLVFLIVGYRFLAHFIKGSWRFLAFVIFVSASGLGWFIYPSADITQIEATNFLNLYESLINPISLIFILLIFLQFLKVDTAKPWRQIVWTGLLANFLILTHSYDFIVVLAVTGTYALYIYSSQRLSGHVRLFLYMLLAAFPAALWQVYVLQKNPILGIWATIQSRVPYFQSGWFYLIGGGIPIIFALIGAGITWYHREFRRYGFLILWLAISLFLLFGPFFERFQRKLSIGLFIPLNILATVGFMWWLKQIPRRWIQSLAAVITVLLMSFTNFYVVALDLKYLRDYEDILYITRNTQSSLDWIGDNVSDYSVILTGPSLGNLIPGRTGKTVYLGHYDQTVNFYEKYELAKNELSSIPHFRDPLPQFLQVNNIDLIVVDEEIRSWGGLITENRPYLRSVYKNHDVEIYKIQ